MDWDHMGSAFDGALRSHLGRKETDAGRAGVCGVFGVGHQGPRRDGRDVGGLANLADRRMMGVALLMVVIGGLVGHAHGRAPIWDGMGWIIICVMTVGGRLAAGLQLQG
jgi:hypothetical protein